MSRKKLKQTPKRVLRLPDLDFAKSAVLNTFDRRNQNARTGSRSTTSLPGIARNRG
jgi:hypothetical protein